VVRRAEAIEFKDPPVTAKGSRVRDPALDLPLSGWWRRFGSGAIDSLLAWALTGLMIVIAAPGFLRRFYHGAVVEYAAWQTCFQTMGTNCSINNAAYQQDSQTLLLVAGGVTAIYCIVFIGTWGATLGQKLCGIQVVRAPVPVSMMAQSPDKPFAAEKPGWLRAFSKGLSWALFSTGGGLFLVVQLVNALLPLWHRRKQSLTDMFANTLIIRHVSDVAGQEPHVRP